MHRRRYNPLLDYKPIPLRLPFLSICAALFAICIVLVEILLRNVSPYSPPNSTPQTQSISLSIHPRSISPSRATSLVQRADSDLPATYCANAPALPSLIAQNRQSSDSLCSEFTASYKGHSANMSYPMKTAVSQWLEKFNSVTQQYWDLRGTSLECTPSARTGPVTWSQATVDVGCALSVTNVNAPCTGFGTIYITGFQLTSAINPVCGVSTSQLLVPTTQPRDSVVTARGSTISSSLLVQTSQPSPTNTQDIIPTSQQRVASTSSMPSNQGVPTIILSTSAVVQLENTLPSVISVPSNTADGTTIIGIQSEASRTLVTAIIGSQTTIMNNMNIPASGSQTTLTKIVGGTTVVTTIPALTSMNGVTAVTAIVSGSTIITTIPVASVTNGDLLVATIISGQAVVSTISRMAVTAIVNGKTIITDVVSPVSGGSKTLITEVVSGKTVTTEIGITNVVITEPSPLSIYTTTTRYISMMTTTDSDGKLTSFSAIVIQTMLATSTVSINAFDRNETSVTRPPQPTLTLEPSEEIVNGTFTTASYFAAQYLPTLIAVLIKALWEMVFAAIKLVEPFERMNGVEGASAKYSIFAQYLSTSLSLDVVRSVGHGNFAPLAASFALILIQIATPSTSAAMSVKSNDWCIIHGQVRRCDPIWIVNTAIMRGVQASLGVCLLITISLAVLVRRFRPGISSDPSSIGALALLTQYEKLNRDIQRINPDTDYNLFEEALEKYQFWLGGYKNADGMHKYGIMGSRDIASLSNTVLRNRGKHGYNQVMHADPEVVMPQEQLDFDTQSQFSTHSNSYTQTSILTRVRDAFITDMLGLLIAATVFALVIAYYLDPRDDSFNSFFNSGSLQSRFLMVGLATVAAFQLSHIERVVRITEPFRRLSLNFGVNTIVPHETSILVPRSGTAYSSLLGSVTLLVNHEVQGGRMSFQTFVACTAILSDLNIIAISGIAWNEAQTAAVYSGSSISAIILSSVVLLMWLVIFIWWRNDKTVKIVRATKGAGTIGGMMRYLVGGGQGVVVELARIAEEWEMRNDTGRIDGRGRDVGLKPCFGRFMGDDGKDRWCIGFLKVKDG